MFHESLTFDAPVAAPHDAVCWDRPVIADIALALFRLIFEGLLTLTGEILLWTLSLGRHKPRWDLYVDQRPMKFYLLNDASMYIGIAFWLVIAVAVHRLFFAGATKG